MKVEEAWIYMMHAFMWFRFLLLMIYDVNGPFLTSNSIFLEFTIKWYKKTW